MHTELEESKPCIVVILGTGLGIIISSWFLWVYWLKEVQVLGNEIRRDITTKNSWAHNKSYKQNKHKEVDNRESNDSSLAEFRLLGGVNWWSDLFGRSEPEKHGGMA